MSQQLLFSKMIKVAMVVITAAVFCGGCTMANPKEKTELSYREKGIEQINKGEFAKAAKTFQKALDNSNGRISEVELDICFYKAYALIESGEGEEAKEVYEAILGYDAKNAEANYLLGNYYVLLEEYEQAAKYYDQAIKLDKNNYEIYLGIYENYMAAGKSELAQNYLYAALKNEADSAEDYCYQGRIYLLLEDYSNAKVKLSEAENKGSDQARLYMARALELSGDSEGASVIFKAYVKDHPDDKEAVASMLRYEIVAQEQNGDFAGAAESIEKLLEIYPGDEQAMRELVFVKSRIQSE